MKEFILKYKFIIIAIAILSIILIGGTYAWINIELFGEKTNKIIAGTLELNLDESTCTEINITNAYPISDEEGMKQVACTFTLENTGTLESMYTIFLDDEELLAGEERMNDSDVKYSLVKNGENKIEILSLTGTHPNRVVDNGILSVGSSNTYELRLWIDENASVDAMGKVVSTKLRVVSEVYQPKGCLDIPSYGGIANAPELVGEMIPVVYDEVNDTWVKADITNTDNSWYDYDEQKWANVVTVTDVNRSTYVSSSVGTTIPMEDINTFMVWIPRYSYTIKDTYGVQGCGGDTPSLETPGAFDIKFINSNTTDLGTAEYTGDTAENWFTNSAFCWGNSCDDETTRAYSENRELSGIWVTKFETSNSGSSTPNSLPNKTSWKTLNIATMFNIVQTNMNSTNGQNIYGLSGSTYDTHLMKNTEWGAAAYLAQSRYGKYGNIDYTGLNKELYQNKSLSYKTGSSNGTPSQSTTLTQCLYNNIEDRGNGTGSCGGGASTTGNITGIYDMSGGSFEYVMGNMQVPTGGFHTNSSGFTTTPEEKYYNLYLNGSSSSDYTRYIKGDATKEMVGFYSDYNSFVNGSDHWFYRGGYYNNENTSSGIAYFNSFSGYSSGAGSFRLVLVP